MRKLLLPMSGFPAKINSISSITIPPTATSKQEWIEHAILHAINTYNPKMKLQEVEYTNIKDQFPNLPINGGKLFGAIVEDENITANNEDYYRNNGYYVWSDGVGLYARYLVTYVFILDLEVDGRNVVAQSIFPELIELMDMTLDGPSYKIANHPVYIINMLGSRITQHSIYYPIAGMIAANMEYIEVFVQTPDLSNVPSRLKDFIIKYESSYRGASTFSTPDFEIDFDRKVVSLKVDRMVAGDYLEFNSRTSLYAFKGSSEKFYWVKILPLILLAQKDNYLIEYDELEDFYTSFVPRFSSRGSKLPRFLTLINFIKKLS